VIDAHNYDIAMVDYMVENGLGEGWDDYASYTVGHAAQLWDSAFHAGKSFTDTGYYQTIYGGKDFGTLTSTISAQEGPRYFTSESSGLTWQKGIIKPGSIFQWEEQDGREIVSGDTINEFHDTRNDLHFYILAKNTHEGKYGDFISYTVGMLHGAGVAVDGELIVELADVEKDLPGNVAVAYYKVTNTGSATDIVRLGVKGDIEGVLLNDLYAVGAGETIIVPVYIEVPEFAPGWKELEVTAIASSESNATKIGEATVTGAEFIWEKVDQVVVSAFVEKLNGNKNNLTITLIEYYNSGRVETYTKTFSINNNAEGIYDVAGYNVYVDTKGNTQIRACYVVE
ncbi:MAG: hypothetical protein FWG61_05560, partial [Firmicutes bacterium]|nr:hypothetical protein [Bacillota bacterium]